MSGPRSSPLPPPLGGYELIDAGEGRRLERFGSRVVDRPGPAAIGPVRVPGAWAAADLAYEAPEPVAGRPMTSNVPGGWTGPARFLDPWMVELDGLTFELRPTAAGQVGLFPEQLPMLGWLAARLGCAKDGERGAAGPPAVLNLYAHTGAVTLACARSGARVVHLDGSRPAVAWARRNARLSGLGDAPIRWIVDDVSTFVARELRRGRLYQGIVLDPPSYGHGPRGRDWRLEQGLPGLLASCARLLAPDARFVLLTAHTPGHGPAVLTEALGDALGRRCEGGWLDIVAGSGAVLRLGAYARWRTS